MWFLYLVLKAFSVSPMYVVKSLCFDFSVVECSIR